MQQQIVDKLTRALQPSHLVVEDESHRHNVPPDAQSHFKVTVVAALFADLSPVERHRKVNGILAEELAGQIHALALHTLSDQEWQAGGEVPASPPCLGGSQASGSA